MGTTQKENKILSKKTINKCIAQKCNEDIEDNHNGKKKESDPDKEEYQKSESSLSLQGPRSIARCKS